MTATASEMAEMEQTSMALEFGDWASPNGHDCPVDEHLVVEIERRDGSINRGPAGHWASPYRHQSSWWHNGGGCDIVRYRPAYFVDTAAVEA